jgi:multidrug resistance efflux pump
MDLLLSLTYTATCVFIFKVPLNKWTMPSAILGGIVLIGALLLVMNYNHPYSETVRQYFVTTPIIPEVRGRVVEVPVSSNTPIKQGDVLYKIDQKPFVMKIRGLEGEMVAARTDLERFAELYKKQVGSERARDQAQAKVDDARFDLKQTVVNAPSDGFVTQIALRPGMMALPLAFNPVMTFVHKEDRTFVGWFRQDSLLRLTAGDEAEMTFDAVPGVIFKGEVEEVLPIIPEGQLKPGADFLRYDQQKNPGRVPVKIKITDLAFAHYQLPGGLFGQAAIYSEHFHHVGILHRVLLRMAAWMNYVDPLH